MLNPHFAPNTMILCAVCFNRDGKLFAGSARFPKGTATVEAARATGFHRSHANGLTFDQMIAAIEFAQTAPALAPIVVEDRSMLDRKSNILAARELKTLDEEAANRARVRAARKFDQLESRAT